MFTDPLIPVKLITADFGGYLSPDDAFRGGSIGFKYNCHFFTFFRLDQERRPRHLYPHAGRSAFTCNIAEPGS